MDATSCSTQIVATRKPARRPREKAQRQLAATRPKSYRLGQGESFTSAGLTVTSANLRRVVVAILACAVTRVAGAQNPPARPPAAPPAKPVQPAPPMDHSHMDMGDMSAMDMPVTIPPGAIYTEADVRFMQGMIAHHAQAIYMSRLAAGRQASPRLLKFANKIDQSQQAEIRLMQDWLRANHQMAPDTNSWRTMHMPGMLTEAQLATLDASKGAEFDRQFLTLMIQHHQGALSMVKDLFASPGAGQDVDVSVFATDVQTVQTAEIDTMHQMLSQL